MNKVIAKLPTVNVENAQYPSGNKELIDALSIIVNTENGLHEAVTCRVYMGKSPTASVVYAVVWVCANGLWFSGRGQAGGGGYDKKSAAIGDAIRSAGIDLSEDINGTGRHCEALEAIAQAAYPGCEFLTVTH